MLNIHIEGRDISFEDALKAARAAGGNHRKLHKVRTKTTRILAMPEKVTGRQGDRIFGAERLRPVTAGHRFIRTFVFVGSPTKEKKT